MRSWLFAPLLALAAATAAGIDGELSLTESRPVLVAPQPAAEPSLIEARIEPTKRELRYDDVLAAERWEQGFLLAARLPVSEAVSLRQEFRTGLQSETVLGDELSTSFRDAIAALEKTSADFRASDALRIAASIQAQWLANNSVPFAEIVTYGTEASFTPVKRTTLKLQLEAAQREEFAAAAETSQETYRLALEQELSPQLKAAAGVSLTHFDDALRAERESLLGRVDASVRWAPVPATTVTFGGERSEREAAAAVEEGTGYALKVQQQVFSRSKLELQAGYAERVLTALEAPPTAGSTWNLGASSDISLHEDWNAGLGVRYRLSDRPAVPPTPDDLTFSLSLKGRF